MDGMREFTVSIRELRMLAHVGWWWMARFTNGKILLYQPESKSFSNDEPHTEENANMGLMTRVQGE